MSGTTNENWSDLSAAIAAYSVQERETREAIRIIAPRHGQPRFRSPVKSSRTIRRYLTHSSKTPEGSVEPESEIERAVAHLLDAAPMVKYFSDQPVRIEFSLGGRPTWHVPDFLVEVDARSVFIEVKEITATESEEFQERTGYLSSALAAYGYGYGILTELVAQRQPRLANIRHLRKLAPGHLSAVERAAVLDAVSRHGKVCSWQSLVNAGVHWHAARLILSGDVEIDLHAPLNPDTHLARTSGGV